MNGCHSEIITVCQPSDRSTRLADYIYANLPSDVQTTFVDSFVVSLSDKSSPYPISGEDVMTWLEYSKKSNFRRFFERNLEKDTDYIIEEGICEGLGRPSYKVYFTPQALKDLGMAAQTSTGKMVRKYYIELEKLVFKFDELQRAALDASREEERRLFIQAANQKVKEALDRAEAAELVTDANKNGYPCGYIFKTDITDPNSDSKIGISDRVARRQNEFKVVAPKGRMVFHCQIPQQDMRKAEAWLHLLLTLAGYHVAGEVFKNIDVDIASYWVTFISYSFRLAEIKNKDIQNNILKKVTNLLVQGVKEAEAQGAFSPYVESKVVSTFHPSESSTEEPGDALLNIQPIIIDNQFNQFIDECCIVEEGLQVSSKDITGKHRLWKRESSKQMFHNFLKYLNTRFLPVRLQVQDKDSVINGFSGVTLKPEPVYILPAAPTLYEEFVYEDCERGPAGKLVFKEALYHFENWYVRRLNCLMTDDQKKVHKKALNFYLKDQFFASNIWKQEDKNTMAKGAQTKQLGGSGFYGVQLKADKNCHRTASSTSKTVYKKDLATGKILDTWSTIALAAAKCGISAASMSRRCDNASVIDGCIFVSRHIEEDENVDSDDEVEQE